MAGAAGGVGALAAGTGEEAMAESREEMMARRSKGIFPNAGGNPRWPDWRREGNVPNARDLADIAGNQYAAWQNFINPTEYQKYNERPRIRQMMDQSFVDASREQRNAEMVGRLRSEKPGIFGPDHPRMLAGIDAVRGIPGAEFMAGGALDMMEDAAFGTSSDTGEKITAAMELGGILPIGKVAGPLAKKLIGRFFPQKQMGVKELPFDERVTDSSYMDEMVTDADYPDVTDSVDDSINEVFGKMGESARIIRNEKTSFTSPVEAKAVRNQKDDPTAWYIEADPRGGRYNLHPWPRANK
jgi:hypothetical protein